MCGKDGRDSKKKENRPCPKGALNLLTKRRWAPGAEKDERHMLLKVKIVLWCSGQEKAVL